MVASEQGTMHTDLSSAAASVEQSPSQRYLVQVQ